MSKENKGKGGCIKDAVGLGLIGLSILIAGQVAEVAPVIIGTFMGLIGIGLIWIDKAKANNITRSVICSKKRSK